MGEPIRSLKADGTPLDTRKASLYTNAFFIYALSEYSRATGDKKAWKKQERFLIFSRSMRLTGSTMVTMKSSVANGNESGRE